MTYAKRMTFFLFLEDEKNYNLEKVMEKKGKLVTAGHSKGWRNLPGDDYSALLDKASLEIVLQNEVNEAFNTTFVKNVNVVKVDSLVDSTVMIVKKK